MSAETLDEYIPMAVPEVRWGNEAAYLAQCIDTNFVSTVGDFVDRFETEVAREMGVVRAVSTVTGTAAIHLGLVALGVGRDDLVITPSFTFIATANAVSQCGAQPWFFDINPTDWTIDTEQVARVLAEKTRMQNGVCIHEPTGQRVAAILPVHVLGAAADLSTLQKLAKEHNLRLIADGACAIGVTHRGRQVADLADLTTLSFNGNKTITSGGGGMLVGNDEALMNRIKHLASTARTGPTYDHDEVGYNYRMTNLEAAVGLAQLEQLHHFLKRKSEIRAVYDDAFATIDGVVGFPPYSNADTSNWLSGLVFEHHDPDRVDGLLAKMRENRIEARPFWKPVHQQKPYAAAPCEVQRVAEETWARIVTLPSSVSLTPKQQQRVISVVRDYLTR